MKDFKTNGIRNKRTVLLKNMRKKTVRKEKRRNRLRRLIGRVLFVCMILIAVSGVGMGGHLLLTSPFFVVKKITVRGNTHLDEERLQNYEERLATNIFLVNLEAARKDLLQEPYVKDAFLRRELPDRIYIHVEERAPFALLRMDKKEFLVDPEGRILEEVRHNGQGPLPLITGFRRDKEGLWKENLSQILALIETMKNYGYPKLSELREIELSRQHGAVLHPVLGGFEIRCGAGDYLHKMILLKRVAADLARKKWPIEHIDLRFRDQVVIGTKRTV